MSAELDPTVYWLNELNRAEAILRAKYFALKADSPVTSALNVALTEMSSAIRERRRWVAGDCAPWFNASAFK